MKNNIFLDKNGKEKCADGIETNTTGWITSNYKSMFENISRSTESIASDNCGQVLVSVIK